MSVPHYWSQPEIEKIKLVKKHLFEGLPLTPMLSALRAEKRWAGYCRQEKI